MKAPLSKRSRENAGAIMKAILNNTFEVKIDGKTYKIEKVKLK